MFHNLQRLLEKAISETNAQYDPHYIISRLDAKILTVNKFQVLVFNRFLIDVLTNCKVSPNDVGWDVFSLTYNLDGPLETVFKFFCLNLILISKSFIKF